MRRCGIVFYLVILLVTLPAATGLAAIGDLLETTTLTKTSSDYGYAYHLSSYDYTVARGSLWRVASTGEVTEEITVPSELSVDFTRSGKLGFAAINSSEWLGLSDASSNYTLYHWKAESAFSGGRELTLVSQVSLLNLLDDGMTLKDFARGPDGSLWVMGYHTVDSATSSFVMKLSSAGTAVVAMYDGIPKTWIGTLSTGGLVKLAVDQTSGYLLLGLNDSNKDGLSRYYCYVVDPANGSLHGRFLIPDYINGCEWLGADNRLVVIRYSTASHYDATPLEQLPSITSVGDFDPRGVFWLGSTSPSWLTYQYDFTVDWAGSAGRVTLTESPGLYGNQATVEDSLVTVQYKPDTGLQLVDQPYQKVRLFNGEDQVSSPQTIELDIAGYGGDMPIPMSPLSWEKENDVLKWNVDYAWPSPVIDFTLTVPSFFPFIGGKRFGIDEFTIGATATIASVGEEVIGMSGGGNVLLGSGKLGLRAAGGVIEELTPDGLQANGGQVSLTLSGSYKEECGLLSLFPPLEASKSIPIIGRVLTYLNSKAKVIGTLFAEGTATAKVVQTTDNVLALKGENAYSVGLSVTGVFEPIQGIAEAAVYGEARTTLVMQSNPYDEPTVTDPFGMTFKEWIVRLMVGTRLVIYGATLSQQQTWSLRYPWEEGGASLTQAAPKVTTHALGGTGWRYTYGGKTDRKTGAGVVIPKLTSTNPLASLDTRRVLASVPQHNSEAVVLTDLAGVAAPAAALAPDGQMMIVWQQEVDGLPATQASDLYYVYFDGEAFTEPAPIRSDYRADFHPTVAWHKSGRWIALWQQVATDALEATGDALADAQTQIEQLVPAYSIFDPDTGKWTKPARLDTTGTSYRVKLATGPTHDVTAFWMKSPTHELMPIDLSQTGDEGNPTYIYYARMAQDGSKLYTPDLALDWPYVFSDFDAADNGTERRLAVVDWDSPVRDPLSSSTVVVRCFKNTVSGLGGWFEMDPEDDIYGYDFEFAPRVLAMSDGTWRVAWQNPGSNQLSIVMTSNLDNRDLTARAIVSDLPQQWSGEYQLGETADGDVFAVLKDNTQGNPNLRIVFDDGTVASLPGALLDDAALERNVCAATASDGEVVVVYYKGDIEKNLEWLELGGEDSGNYWNVAEAATGKLAVLRHRIVRDLAAGGVILSHGVLLKGSQTKVEATVENIGDLPVGGATVSIYAQKYYSVADASDPVITIAEGVALSGGTLLGHDERTVEVTWQVPETAVYRAWAVVDPQNAIEEADEYNNQGAANYLAPIPENAAADWALFE